jgi:SAM-dependent methyltransferase
MDDSLVLAFRQYGGSTRNLDLRVAIHRYGSNAQSWSSFVAAHLPMVAGDRVLDGGAGTGVHWQSATTGRPVLLDLHIPMCQSLIELGHPVVCASAEALPVRSAAFDGVMATHVLYHVPDPELAIREMLRAVRPGGWIALASNGPAHMRTLDELRCSVGLHVDASMHDRFSASRCVDSLRGHGLAPRRHDYPGDLQVTDAEAVVGYCSSLGPLTETQAAAIRRAVNAELVAAGSYRIEKETALVVART